MVKPREIAGNLEDEEEGSTSLISTWPEMCETSFVHGGTFGFVNKISANYSLCAFLSVLSPLALAEGEERAGVAALLRDKLYGNPEKLRRTASF